MIEVTLEGRTGNQMFQYAMCRSVAEKNGYDFYVNPLSWLGKDLFNVNLGGRFGYCHDLPHTFKEPGHKYYPEVWDVKDGTLLIGYFQSEKYFNHKGARNWFRYDNYVGNNTQVNSLLETYPIEQYCYINLRGTDVKTLGVQKLPKEYYTHAMAIIQSQRPDIKFVVITDDIPFGKEYFPDFPVMSNSVRTDFILLNKAKYIVLANSSFAWWAAWLNESNFAIAPHGWLDVNQNKWICGPADIKVSRFIWI
jgi:hypothetical protein